MDEQTESEEPPDSLVETLDELDAPDLRAVRTYVEKRLDHLRPSLRELIRSEVDGEIVDIEDHGAYTLVRKYPPNQSNAEDASRPLSLYRVKREKQINDEETLHWSYLGDIAEPVDSDCQNCGGETSQDNDEV